MSKNRFKEKGAQTEGFVRKTITIPAEVAPFAEKQANRPEHAGNLSSYLRALILRDREIAEKQAA